jgi:hypothetical protein
MPVILLTASKLTKRPVALASFSTATLPSASVQAIASNASTLIAMRITFRLRPAVTSGRPPAPADAAGHPQKLAVLSKTQRGPKGVGTDTSKSPPQHVPLPGPPEQGSKNVPQP